MKKISSPFTLIKNSFYIFSDKANLKYFATIYLPAGILSAVSLLVFYVPFLAKFASTSAGSIVMTIFNVVFVLVMVFVNLAGILAVTGVVKKEKSQVKEIYNKAISMFWKFLLLSIVVNLINILGIFLLILPFFLFVTWFAFGKFVMVNEKLGIRASLVKSKAMVKGVFWKILLRIVVFGIFTISLQMLLGLIPYGIGTVAFYLCGALFILPVFLLFNEIASQ